MSSAYNRYARNLTDGTRSGVDWLRVGLNTVGTVAVASVICLVVRGSQVETPVPIPITAKSVGSECSISPLTPGQLSLATLGADIQRACEKARRDARK